MFQNCGIPNVTFQYTIFVQYVLFQIWIKQKLHIKMWVQRFQTCLIKLVSSYFALTLLNMPWSVDYISSYAIVLVKNLVSQVYLGFVTSKWAFSYWNCFCVHFEVKYGSCIYGANNTLNIFYIDSLHAFTVCGFW